MSGVKWRRWSIFSVAIALVFVCMALFSYESANLLSTIPEAQEVDIHPRTVNSLPAPIQIEAPTRETRAEESSPSGPSAITQSPVALPVQRPVETIQYQEKPLLDTLYSEPIERKGRGSFLGAGVRGFVEKAGMVPPTYYAVNSRAMRQTGFDNWLRAYLNGNLVSHAPTPFPQCQVYINHDYKFIWIKGHKVGSTSMRGPLRWLCDDKWRVPKNADFQYCSHPVFKNESLAVSDLRRWWREYFVFGIVRNPYTRFASAEEYIGNMIPQSCGRPTFEQTCREPFVHTRVCKTRQCCFGGAAAHHYRHFMEQSSCLFTDSLLPAVDFIGEVENLSEDFDTIIDTINRHRDPHLPALVDELKKKNAHGRRLQAEAGYADRLFKAHPSCLQSIAKFFHRDFTLLDYEQLDKL